MRTSKIMSVSLPPTLLKAAERAAKKEGRTKSELFREALRLYLRQMKWAELRRYGAARAMALGIRESDVDRLGQEYRQEKQ